MKKVMICLIGCFLMALATVQAQDTGKSGADSVIQLGPDTTVQTPAAPVATPVSTGSSTASIKPVPAQATISRDTTTSPVTDTSFRYRGDADSAKTASGAAAAGNTASGAASGNTASGAASGNPASGAASGNTASGAAATDAASGNSGGAAAASGRKPDTLISLINEPKDKDATVTQNQDTTTTKKTVGGSSIEVKTVGANAPDTSKPDQAKTDAPAQNDPAKTDATARNDEPKDTATSEDKAQERTHKLDPRWFIGVKGQFQDFGLLEKNRKGYLSDANTLPFFSRGNGSLALSAYKNLTQRMSLSADLGLSFGHATSNDVLISQTKSQTFNLINAALYYHLLSPAYKLQPYVTVGFNDIINAGSYPSVPMGIGAKFNGRKIMALAQVTYGQSVSKSVANTTMYSVGIYIPIKSKKYKNLDTLDNTPYNRKKDEAKKKDSTGKGGNVINNIYVTINMDSILKVKGLLDENGKPVVGHRGGGGSDDGDDDGDDAVAKKRRRRKPFNALGLDDFNDNEYRIDTLDGKPIIRFVVYFEFNEYGLTGRAFNSIDRVIGKLKKSPDFSVEIKGYTDSVGSDPYNNMLSRRRAKMVLDYMNSRGVPTELMKAKAYGSDNPVADNSDPNKAWLNRRAEIIIHPKDGLAIQ